MCTIGVLELEACMICLQHWAHELAGTSVLCYMDKVQAVSAVYKGGSRITGIRDDNIPFSALGKTLDLLYAWVASPTDTLCL